FTVAVVPCVRAGIPTAVARATDKTPPTKILRKRMLPAPFRTLALQASLAATGRKARPRSPAVRQTAPRQRTQDRVSGCRASKESYGDRNEAHHHGVHDRYLAHR